MSLIKYRVWSRVNRVERFEFARETAQYYIKANGSRDAKISRWYRFFDTEAEALQFIAERQQAGKDAKRLKQIEKAAPDLLAALQELADLVDDMVSGNYKPDSFTTQPARAAIAKATGGDL